MYVYKTENAITILLEGCCRHVCDVLKMKLKIFRLIVCQHGVKTMKAVSLDDTAIDLKTHTGLLTSFIRSQVNVSSMGGSSMLNLSVRYKLRVPRYADPWYGRGPSAYGAWGSDPWYENSTLIVSF
jgi:hypothetical protein